MPCPKTPMSSNVFVLQARRPTEIDFLPFTTLAFTMLNRWSGKSPGLAACSRLSLITSDFISNPRLQCFIGVARTTNERRTDRNQPSARSLTAAATYTEAHFHVGGREGEEGGDGVVNPRNRELKRDSLSGLRINEWK